MLSLLLPRLLLFGSHAYCWLQVWASPLSVRILIRIGPSGRQGGDEPIACGRAAAKALLDDLASLYLGQGRLREAEVLELQALETRRWCRKSSIPTEEDALA